MKTTVAFNFLTDNELEARINEYNATNAEHDTNWSVKHINTFLCPRTATWKRTPFTTLATLSSSKGTDLMRNFLLGIVAGYTAHKVLSSKPVVQTSRRTVESLKETGKAAVKDWMHRKVDALLFVKPAEYPVGDRRRYDAATTSYSRFSRPGKGPQTPYAPKVDMTVSDSPMPLSMDFDRRQDAWDVVSKLEDLLQEYGAVYVSDVHDTVGTESTYEDSQWGWTNLEDVAVYRSRGGWTLHFPVAAYKPGTRA